MGVPVTSYLAVGRYVISKVNKNLFNKTKKQLMKAVFLFFSPEIMEKSKLFDRIFLFYVE